MSRQLIQVPAISADLLELIKRERVLLSLGPMKIETRAASGDSPAEMYLYGEIGNPFDGADSATFGRFMRSNKGKPINVRINSNGGLAYDGITIHNAIMQHDAPTTTIIEGMAGSAASIIAVAGTTVQMFQNATFFIHRAELRAAGNVDVMKEAISWLAKIDQQIVDTYRAKTGRPQSMIMKEMIGSEGEGTPFNASEALAGKYIDKIMPMKRSATAAELESAVTADRKCSVTRLRDMRIHSRKDVLPTQIVALIDAPKLSQSRSKTTAQGGPMYDVGDMVKVMEDGKTIGQGEVRSSMLGYVYDVMQKDGTMIEDCCEGDLMLMGDETS